jgi:hypothetical protein
VAPPRLEPRAASALAALTVFVFLLAVVPAAGSTARGGPILQTAPSVLGTAAAGKLLTGLSGSWSSSSDITYRYQWYRCNAAGGGCASIGGAHAPTYALGDRDVGKTLGLTVRASDPTGTATAFASLVGPIAPTRPLLESTAQPVVAGPPIRGKTVQVTTGTWSPVPAELAYRWLRCNRNGRACSAISNATGSSYTIGDGDVGHALLVIVQATNGTTIQSAFSTATPTVVDGSSRGPHGTVEPTLTGLAIAGQQLTAETGVWRGVGPVVYAYHWYRCDTDGSHCTLIRTRNGPHYTTGARDVGSTIGLTLRVSDSTGAVSVYAPLVGPVAATVAMVSPTTPPTIAGTARVGGALRVDPGVWTPEPTGYAYSWLRCNHNGRLCTPIPGATRAAYRPTADDRGHALVAMVLARVRGGSQTALSSATAPIA